MTLGGGQEAKGLVGAVRDAVSQARVRLGDPAARVVCLVPARTIGDQLARGLGAAGGWARVDFLTLEEVIDRLAALALAREGLRPEPAGWASAWLRRTLPRLAGLHVLGRHGQALLDPGWGPALHGALVALEAGGVDARMLDAVEVPERDLLERAQLLAMLLRSLQGHRQDDGLASRVEIEALALEALDGRHRLGDVRAAVILGDALLTPGAGAVARRWFGGLDLTRVVTHPLEALAPTPGGLREAASGAHLVEVPPAPGALGHLQRTLWTRGGGAAPDEAAPTVSLVSLPDGRAEAAEAVREALVAIRGGVAPERVALVLPDPAGADALEDALERAGLPAVWLTALPLARRACAGGVLTLAEVALGGGTPQRWYGLLTRAELVAPTGKGRGRWRRLMARLAPGTWTAMRLLAWLDGQAGATDDEGEAEALASLRARVRALEGHMAALGRSTSARAFAQAAVHFLEVGWARSRSRARLIEALGAWGRHGTGRLSASDALGLLRERLEATPDLRGELTEAGVRVVAPMLLPGGGYEVVCALGMSEGRFPASVVESPLLPEGLIRALRAAGATLPDLEARRQIEVRRQGTLVAACQGRLWLSWPRRDGLEGRPALPGGLVLSAAAALRGEPVGHAGLAKVTRTLGEPTPERALDAAEALLARALEARAHASSPAKTEVARELLAHPVARGLVRLHRSVDRVRLGQQEPDAWTGRVDPGLLSAPGLDGRPLSPAQLRALVHDPAGFFFQHVLGASPAPPLRAVSSPLSGRRLRDAAALAAREALSEGGGRFEDRFDRRWAREVGALIEEAGGLVGPGRAMLLGLGRIYREQVMRAVGGDGRGQRFEVAEVELLPSIKVAGVEARVVDGALVSISTGRARTINAERDAGIFERLARAVALQRAGHPVEALAVASVSGGGQRRELDGLVEGFDAMVTRAVERAGAGLWPVASGASRVALGREGQGGQEGEG